MSTATPPPTRNRLAALWLPVASLLVAIPALVVSINDALSGDTLPATIAALITATFIIASLSSLALVWQGRPEAGTLVQLGALGVYALLLTLQFADFAGNLLVVVALAAMVAATAVLPSGMLNRLVPAAVVVTVAGILLDVVWPAPRFSLNPQLRVFVQIVAVVVGVLLVFVLVRQFQRVPLRIKLLVLFLAVALGPLGIITALSNQQAETLLRDNAISVLQSSSGQLRSEMGAFISRHEELLRSGTQPLLVASYLRLPAQQRLNNALNQVINNQLAELHSRTEPEFSSIALFDASGSVTNVFRLAGTPPRQGLEVGRNLSRANYLTALDGQPGGTFYLSPVIYTTNPPDATFYFAMPITDLVSGQRLGTLVVQYDAAVLEELLGATFPDSDTTTGIYPMLIDNRNLVLASLGPRGQTNRILTGDAGLTASEISTLRLDSVIPLGPVAEIVLPAPLLTERLAVPGQATVFEAEQPISNTPVLVFAELVGQQSGWRVLTVQPQSAILAPIAQQRDINVAVGAVLALVITGLTLVIVPYLASGLVRLNRTASEVASGTYDVQVDVETEDEIGALAETFNLMTQQLRQSFGLLEQRVDERTQQLFKVAHLARTLGQYRDPQTLMAEAVDAITQDFGLYYSGIFLLNETGEYAVLRAGSGDAGRAMLSDRHQLDVGGRSMIGQAVATGQPRIAFDVEEERVRFRNPHLPLTRTELALPLQVGDRVTGALTVQSSRSQAFDDADIATFQGLADQLAIAITNAQLFSEQAANLERINRLNEALLGGTWQVGPEGEAEFEYDGRTFVRVQHADFTNIDIVMNRPRLALEENVPAGRAPRVTLPLQVRGETIGAFELVPPAEKTHWTREELSLLEQIIGQAGYSLETALLVDQVQRALNASRRATERERTLARITDEIRQNVDVNTILSTTLRRLGEVLGADAGEIEIRPASGENAPPPPTTNGQTGSPL